MARSVIWLDRRLKDSAQYEQYNEQYKWSTRPLRPLVLKQWSMGWYEARAPTQNGREGAGSEQYEQYNEQYRWSTNLERRRRCRQ